MNSVTYRFVVSLEDVGVGVLWKVYIILQVVCVFVKRVSKKISQLRLVFMCKI